MRVGVLLRVCARACVHLTFCPQASTALTVEGVSELPPDAGRIAAVAQYRVIDAASKKDENAVVCQMCDDGYAAFAHCADCAAFLCEGCSTYHRKQRITAKHVVAMLGEATVGAAASAAAWSFRRQICCREHTGEPMRMFCTTCNKAECMICGMLKHSGHKIVDTATASAGMRDTLRAAVAEIGFDAAAEGAFKTALAAKIADVTRVHDATNVDIDAAAEAHISAVNERRGALKKVSDDLLTVQLATLRAQAKAVELHVDSVTHAIKFATDVAAHGTDSEVGVTHVAALARLGGAKGEHTAVPWTPACEGPATLRLATRDALAAWLAEQCRLVTAREAEEERAAAAAAVAAAAAAAERKRAEDTAAAAAAAEAMSLRLRGA